MIYRVLGVAALALAGVGAVLPVMPTTVFLIIAAWAFARSSPRLHRALMEHPRFGPVLENWERYGAIPRAGKAAAVVGMAASWILILALSHDWIAALLSGVALAAAAAYVLSRPRPPSEVEAAQKGDAAR